MSTCFFTAGERGPKPKTVYHHGKEHPRAVEQVDRILTLLKWGARPVHHGGKWVHIAGRRFYAQHLRMAIAWRRADKNLRAAGLENKAPYVPPTPSLLERIKRSIKL